MRISVAGGQWSAAHARSIHLRTRNWLEAELAAPFDGLTVVATHHGPLPRAAMDTDTGTPGDAAFHSDLSDIVRAHAPHMVC